MVTPAVPKIQKEFGIDMPAVTAEEDEDGDDEPTVSRAAKHHNSGGEMLLFAQSLIAHGQHQSPGAVGYRAAQVRSKGWTLHLITLYLDCNHGVQDGPNKQRS